MDSPLAISDPLSAGQADRCSVARNRLRRTGAVLYAAAALTQLGVLFAPDPDPSDHVGLAVVALVCALVALALVVWRRPPLAASRCTRSARWASRSPPRPWRSPSPWR